MSTAAAPARRQFQLFESSVRSSLPRVLKQPHELSCVAASSDTLYIGDTHGCVHSFGAGWEEGPVWRPYENGRCTFILPVEQLGIITAGEDAKGLPILRLYALAPDVPDLLRSVKLANFRHPVTCMAVSNSLSQLAVGLGDGTVLLYKHFRSLFAPVSTSAATGFGKQHIVHEGTDPITGLGFLVRQAATETTKEALSVMIATTNKIIEARLNGTATTIDESGGAKLGCAKMHDGKLLVAREEAIYVYGQDGKEGCFAFEGPKQALYCLSHQNVLILSPPSRASMDSQSATIRNYAKSRPADAPIADAAKATIFEVEDKFVAFSGTYDEPIRDAWELWGSVWLLTMDAKVYQLNEQPIATSLGLMYAKNLYTLAVSFAQTRRLPEAQIAEIHKRHGDHLYAKADYDGAIGAYLQTIPFVPPSHVIRKFLDAQRLANLTSYLSELHKRGLANEDHTTLLLNCYTKLGDSDALSDFLNSSSHADTDSARAASAPASPPFNLETAIRVLRQAHYYDHAASLADRYDAHEEYLRIQLEDRVDAESALSHIRKGKLKPEEWRRYVGMLLKMNPRQTTTLVTDVCCGTLVSAPTSSASMSTHAPASKVVNGLDGDKGYNVPGSSDEPSRVGDAADDDEQDLPRPKQFFAYFVEHQDEFVDFLERTLEGRYGIAVDSLPAVSASSNAKVDGRARGDVSALCNTLIEAYLDSDSSIASTTRRRKAFKLMKSTLPYDDAQAFLVCSKANYEDGLVLLYEKMKLYDDLVRYWIDKDDSTRVVKAVRQFGPERPLLYKVALRWLASDPQRLESHQLDVVSLLEDIESAGSIPPVKVIQLLSKTAGGQDTTASVGLVRAYLERHLTKERKEVEADKALTTSYRTESANKRRELVELDDPNAPRVFQVTRCSACGGSLDLPAVHFMCRHSYHQRCLGENETDCPNCARTHGVIREIRKENEKVAAQEGVFLAEVRESEDGYKTVASAFGRGFLNMK